jgi:hypothetical protein
MTTKSHQRERRTIADIAAGMVIQLKSFQSPFICCLSIYCNGTGAEQESNCQMIVAGDSSLHDGWLKIAKVRRVLCAIVSRLRYSGTGIVVEIKSSGVGKMIWSNIFKLCGKNKNQAGQPSCCTSVL